MNKDKTISQNALENSLTIYADTYYTIGIFSLIGLSMESNDEDDYNIPSYIYDIAAKALDNAFMLIINDLKIKHPTEKLLTGIEETIQNYCNDNPKGDFDADELVDVIYSVIDDNFKDQEEESQG